MKVTDAVIQDLLPLYLANEASADTRALVEEYLKAHPELAARAASAELPELPRLGLPARGERAALRHTQRMLRGRSFAMGFGLAFTLLPLSFGKFGERGLHWIFWPDYAGFAVLSLLVGAFCWLQYFRLDRKLRPKGF